MSLFRALVWDETITLYHRAESVDANGKKIIKWTKTVIANCFYGLKARQAVNGTEIASRNTIVARIPLSSISTGFALGKSDIIVRGNISTTLEDNDSGATLKANNAGNCFTVNYVADNTKMPLTAHWYAAED